ncbi:putative sterigmatocystin biosynthesis peroxidase stcC [Madurella mycetomatis]|uniref:Sterigmatocystin biosynthesis peroxidase stcC n=1 Tax=Madurella mycetomatis TaxID=100816 RepID=A0A175WEH5_9PEZI|nr:putative sterigmatocystin biosynthesis peroxidase stcC [Madurella mycetomatis]
MKSSIVFLGYISSLAYCTPSQQALLGRGSKAAEIPDWHPPGPNDFRGPCPMMNTLANHGILPRDGREITEEAVIKAMKQGLNFDAALAVIMFEQAVIANPEPNATSFTLDHLNRHNVLEHDASLSRTDDFFGSNHIFNQTIFDQTRRYWPEPVITPTHMANAKIARQVESKSFNPEYRFTQDVENFSLGEMAAPFIAFGDLEEATVNRALVEYFFQNERLPTELGWRVRDEVVKVEAILSISGMIGRAASLFTDSDGCGGNGTTGHLRRGLGFHAGVRRRL